MKKADKQKLEEEAIRMLASGLNQSETAKKLGISRQNISNWMKSADFKVRIEKLKEDKRKYQQKQSLTTVKKTPHSSLSEPEPQVQPQHKVLSREYYFQKELLLLDEIQELRDFQKINYPKIRMIIIMIRSKGGCRRHPPPLLLNMVLVF
ncbi:MAG: helix-turn-helix domain-containing protein [Cyanobacteria bacterium J06643_5]